MAFKIGDINIENQVVMAPMAGISNPSYMKIIEEMSAGLAFTELLSTEAIVRDNKKTFDMLNGIETLKMPIGVQIFGSNPETMAKAAKKLCQLYPIKIIDINMGCPVPKVAVKSKSGSALLKNPQLVYDIVSQEKKNVDAEVTVKIRSGWDSKNINAIEIAKICEQAGASAITVHGRTRSQGYSGDVDLDIIKKVKENVSIPVIGNGDIKDVYSAKKMLEYTKCDAIMIGRALLGNPWLVKEIDTYLKTGNLLPQPTYIDRINMCYKHLNYLMEFKKENVAVLEMRSHIAWYVKTIPYHKEIKLACFKAKTYTEIIEILDNYKKKLYNYEEGD